MNMNTFGMYSNTLHFSQNHSNTNTFKMYLNTYEYKYILPRPASQHIQKNFPGLLHTPVKCENNPPYGCESIAKRKCGSGGSSRVASPIYKQGTQETEKTLTK